MFACDVFACNVFVNNRLMSRVSLTVENVAANCRPDIQGDLVGCAVDLSMAWTLI